MSVGRIASRYAKSLLDLAVEKKVLEDVKDDMDTLKSAISNREFDLMLKSPIINGDKKKSIIDAIFKDKVNALSLMFFKGVVDKGREGYLSNIAHAFITQYKENKGISSIKLVTANKLTDEAVAAIKDKLNTSATTNQTIEVETAVDASLLGGFIVEFDDKRYDASLSHKLAELRKGFDTNLYTRRI